MTMFNISTAYDSTCGLMVNFIIGLNSRSELKMVYNVYSSFI